MILILDPADFPTDPDVRPQNVELTIIHELLHCQLGAIDDRESHELHVEQAVHALSRAFLDMDHCAPV